MSLALKSGSAAGGRPTSGRLLGSALLAATATAALAVSQQVHEGPSTWDPGTTREVVDHRSGALTALAHALTFLGSELVVAGFSVVVLVLLLARHRIERAMVFTVGMGGSAVLTVAVKLLVARARPPAVDRIGPPDSTFSFPSGHTLNTLVFLALVCWLLRPVLPARVWTVAAAAAVLLGVGVGASRVYLGYHWLTDVVASALIAVAWLSILALVVRRVVRASSNR